MKKEEYNILLECINNVNNVVTSKDLSDMIDCIMEKEEKGIKSKKQEKQISIEDIINKIYKAKRDYSNEEIKNKEETLKKATELRDYLNNIISLLER